MSSLIDKIPLREVATGKAVSAEVYDGISPEHIADWDKKWRPVIVATQERLKKQNAPRSAHPQSSHWDWNKKTAAVKNLLAYRTFAIVCGGDTQGLMVVDTASHRSRLPDERGHNGQVLSYVEFLEVAHPGTGQSMCKCLNFEV